MAKLEACPACGNQTSVKASQCPKCAEPLSEGWGSEAHERRTKAASAVRASKRNKKLFWIAMIVGLPIALVLWANNESNRLANLKTENPEEFQRLVTELEAKVAKVPASDPDENIRLYKELARIDPQNQRYAAKIETYQQKKKSAEAVKVAADRLAKIAAEAERKRKGFHCLSSWNGAHTGVKDYVEKNMRDPDSFEHIETRITPVDKNGEHTLVMKYRAKNGFGGMATGVALAKVASAGCYATITSLN